MSTRFVPLDDDQLIYRVAEKYRTTLAKCGHNNIRTICGQAIDKSYQLDCQSTLDEIRRKLHAAENMSDREGIVALTTIIQSFIPELLMDLKNKIHMFEQRIAQISNHIQKPAPIIEELIEDIKSIKANFPSLGMSGNRVKITTDNIILSDGEVEVEFGKFDVIVFLNREVHDDESGLDNVIQARALSPNPHPEDSRVTHPHVMNNIICMGNGYPAIAQAFQQGRLEDVFRLLTILLNTYNPDSPHFPLETWEGHKCESCGFTPVEDSYSCCECGSEMCEECRTSCTDCGEKYCGGCYCRCEECEDIICPGCSQGCNECGCAFCGSCINKCDCGVPQCGECQKKCASCDKKICESCRVCCENCNTCVCEDCTITCKNCNLDFCKDCYDEDKCSLLKQTTEKKNKELQYFILPRV